MHKNRLFIRLKPHNYYNKYNMKAESHTLADRENMRSLFSHAEIRLRWFEEPDQSVFLKYLWNEMEF